MAVLLGQGELPSRDHRSVDRASHKDTKYSITHYRASFVAQDGWELPLVSGSAGDSFLTLGLSGQSPPPPPCSYPAVPPKGRLQLEVTVPLQTWNSQED